MLFNSLDFAIFFPIVFVLYWLLNTSHVRWQNALVVVASYVFYGWWNWRFLLLILFSTVVDYSIGKQLGHFVDRRHRKYLLWVSLAVNLGLLGFFKYYNFFVESFASAFSLFGHALGSYTLNIILPVGISFYTFQTLSYTIDVYQRRLEPSHSFISFSAFVSFFPQLVAGPIERATHLLPQFNHKRTFHYGMAVDGLRQMLWGVFKKMVIADNCAEIANLVFNNYDNYNSATLALGAIMFAFQIYGDFSGYSDIAIGAARLLGFDLMQNFNYPYFSRDVAEFWRRWHISLTTWFRDYVYIPLGGSRIGRYRTILNTFIIFLVSGFWHGANWTFIAWGFLNALYFMPLLLSGKNKRYAGTVAEGKLLPSFKDFLSIAGTFSLTVLAWIFFRSESITDALKFCEALFTEMYTGLPSFSNVDMVVRTTGLIFIFVAIEWFGRRGKYAIENTFATQNFMFRWVFYSVLIFMIMMFAKTEESPFIYFQF